MNVIKNKNSCKLVREYKYGLFVNGKNNKLVNLFYLSPYDHVKKFQ